MEKIKPQEVNTEKIANEMNNLDRLLKEAEKNEATLSGRLQESMKRLKEEFGLNTIEEAQKEAERIRLECKTLKGSLAQKFQALQEAYEW